MDRHDFFSLVDNFIWAWSQTPLFTPLAKILERERAVIAESLCAAYEGGGSGTDPDEVRFFIIRYVFKSLDAEINPGHFNLFEGPETVNAVAENCFEIGFGLYDDKIIIQNREMVIRVVLNCLLASSEKSARIQEVASFMQFLFGSPERSPADRDRIMRYKAFLWFTYLATHLLKNDWENAWRPGIKYLMSRLKDLLDREIEGKARNEHSANSILEGKKWDGGLLGRLQGESRKNLALSLRKQFNFKNRRSHANRKLRSEDRKRILREVMAVFC